MYAEANVAASQASGDQQQSAPQLFTPEPKGRALVPAGSAGGGAVALEGRTIVTARRRKPAAEAAVSPAATVTVMEAASVTSSPAPVAVIAVESRVRAAVSFAAVAAGMRHAGAAAEEDVSMTGTPAAAAAAPAAVEQAPAAAEAALEAAAVTATAVAEGFQAQDGFAPAPKSKKRRLHGSAVEAAPSSSGKPRASQTSAAKAVAAASTPASSAAPATGGRVAVVIPASAAVPFAWGAGKAAASAAPSAPTPSDAASAQLLALLRDNGDAVSAASASQSASSQRAAAPSAAKVVPGASWSSVVGGAGSAAMSGAPPASSAASASHGSCSDSDSEGSDAGACAGGEDGSVATKPSAQLKELTEDRVAKVRSPVSGCSYRAAGLFARNLHRGCWGRNRTRASNFYSHDSVMISRWDIRTFGL